MLTISAILLAPRYLAYAEPPRQADAVILFLGQLYEARKQEALRLIREEYARVLIIPDRNRVYVASAAGSLKVTDEAPDAQGTPAAYARHLEATHREVLEAKRIMDERGLRTAILVSSPHHMRRIKLIADSVFRSSPSTPLTPPLKPRDTSLPRREATATQTSLPSWEGPREGESPIHPSSERTSSEWTYRLSFVPTRYESTPRRLWFIDGPEFARVTSEYIKIAWFQLYSRFASNPDS